MCSWQLYPWDSEGLVLDQKREHVIFGVGVNEEMFVLIPKLTFIQANMAAAKTLQYHHHLHQNTLAVSDASFHIFFY